MKKRLFGFNVKGKKNRYNKVIEEMNVQASDYSLLRIRDRRESVANNAEERTE